MEMYAVDYIRGSKKHGSKKRKESWHLFRICEVRSDKKRTRMFARDEFELRALVALLHARIDCYIGIGKTSTCGP
jgi:hypothetical protein